MTHSPERQAKIDRYGRGHALLIDAVARYPRAMWQFRPAPDRWTIHEIIVHITDSEANSFVRLRRLIAEPGSTVLGYDEPVWAVALTYHEQSPEDAMELFRWLRGNSYKLLVAQPDEVWSHTVTHTENGLTTMDDWLTTYDRHVTDHIDQMDGVYQAWRQQHHIQ
jgi:hypothetical protein